MNDSAGRESSDHRGDSYQNHCIKVVTKLSGCCINENRSKLDFLNRQTGQINLSAFRLHAEGGSIFNDKVEGYPGRIHLDFTFFDQMFCSPGL